MKEFEKDNWELKARQLADAFQPKPDDSVWLNVEAALKPKKNRRGIFFWLFSFVGVAGVVYGGVMLYLLNTGDQYQSLNKQAEKSKVETVVANSNSSEVVKSVPTVTEQKSEQVAAIKSTTENSPLSAQERKIISSKKQTEIIELKTVVKNNELEEKPDLIITESNELNIIEPINPFVLCGLNFKESEWRTLPPGIILNKHSGKKDSRWMLLATASYMKQHSVLKSNDTNQTFEKQNANYYDGSLHLIHQFPKARNLELSFGLGFYELNQNYITSKEQTVSVFDTTSGNPQISTDKYTDFSTGSEFSRNAFVDFGIGIPIIASRNFSWNISTGIRTEYLIKYTSTSGGVIPNNFANLGINYLESISSNEQNRIYLKGMLNTSVRYSLSRHLAIQSGINSGYSLTDRYNKSSSLQQRDLNFGLNAGLLYRF